MGIKKMKVIFGFPEKRRCCQCKSHMVATLYHNRWYCDTCFQKKQLCCICGENPVEVTKGDNGYCKKCYENSVNTGFTRSVAVLAFCGSLILLLYFFWIKIRLPAILSVIFAMIGSIAVTVGIAFLQRKYDHLIKERW